MALSPTALTPVKNRDAGRFRHPGADRGGPVDLAALRRILLVRPDNVGDVVLLTPAVRALRAGAPRARLDLLGSPAGAAVAAMVPELSEVLVASPSWQQLVAPAPGRGDDPADAARAAARGERDLLDRIAAGSYDAMLVFTSFSQSPWPAAHLGLLAGVPIRVVHSREFGGAVATHWVTPPPDTTHHVDRSLHLVEAIGAPARGTAPSLRVPVTAHAEADVVLAAALQGAHGGGVGWRADAPAPFALLVPGASCPSRRYPASRFGAAAAAVAAGGLPVLVAGTAREAGLVEEVVRAAAAHPGGGPAGVRALPPVGLPVFAALVARAAVALTNNSGGLHLADALGTPVVVTYAGTERRGDVAPRSVPAEVLSVPVPCSPCRQLTCPFHLECLDVTPTDVARAVLRLAGPARGAVPGATSAAAPPDASEEDRWPPDRTQIA
jgi:ADP-heptose:LPS heptosyltransferase